MADVKRIFVEKRPGFDVEASNLSADLRSNLGLKNIEKVRIINRYDISGLDGENFEKAKNTIFSETNADVVYDEVLPEDSDFRIFAMEYLPGQYDQRADSAAQCVQLLTQGERPQVVSAKLVAVKGNITDEEFRKIQNYLINPVESRLASLEKPDSLDMKAAVPANVAVVEGFTKWNDDEMQKYFDSMGFAMTLSDLKFCRDYFRDDEH
ncbi:MAG: phosphoribosylformylglycinamidine synthase, partial [Acutalibacteraceae bacterium]